MPNHSAWPERIGEGEADTSFLFPERIGDIYEARFLPMPPRRMPAPQPPKQAIPMPKMGKKEVLKTLGPFNSYTFNRLMNEARETKERIEGEMNGLMNRLTYPDDIINETVTRKIYKN